MGSVSKDRELVDKKIQASVLHNIQPLRILGHVVCFQRPSAMLELRDTSVFKHPGPNGPQIAVRAVGFGSSDLQHYLGGHTR